MPPARTPAAAAAALCVPARAGPVRFAAALPLPRPVSHLPPGGSSSCGTQRARQQDGCEIMTGRSRLKERRRRGRWAPRPLHVGPSSTGCTRWTANHGFHGGATKNRPINGQAYASARAGESRPPSLAYGCPAPTHALHPSHPCGPATTSCAGGAAAGRGRLGAAGHRVQQRAAHATNAGCDAAGAARAGRGGCTLSGGWGVPRAAPAPDHCSQLWGAHAHVWAVELRQVTAAPPIRWVCVLSWCWWRHWQQPWPVRPAARPFPATRFYML